MDERRVDEILLFLEKSDDDKHLGFQVGFSCVSISAVQSVSVFLGHLILQVLDAVASLALVRVPNPLQCTEDDFLKSDGEPVNSWHQLHSAAGIFCAVYFSKVFRLFSPKISPKRVFFKRKIL